MGIPKQKLASKEYNQEWLNNAWGHHANQKLFQLHTFKARPRVCRAISLLDAQPGMRVLDIACGRGEVPALLAKKGVTVVGLDFSQDALNVARNLRSELDQTHIKSNMLLVRSDACSLPFPDQSFDRISMLDIIEHLLPTQLEQMFQEVMRLLKPNGYAVVHTLPNRWVYDITFPILHRLIKKIPKDPRGPFDRKVHINEQDLAGLSRTLRSIGIAHHLWLEQHMPAQARWNAGLDQYGDTRDTLYPFLTGIAGRALELISLTPLKLVLSNDIFGFLWKNTRPSFQKVPLSLTESLICRLSFREQRAS